MKLVKQLSILFLIFLCNFLLSCSSTPEKKIDSVYVMVYDYDNSGVMDVSIFLNKELIGKTDIYGRLMFPVPTNKNQELSVSVEKEGYEKVEIKIKKIKYKTTFKENTNLNYKEKKIIQKGIKNEAD